MIYLSKGPKETEKLAGFLLKQFLKNNKQASKKKPLIIALEGELGAGKTVFVKGVAKALKLSIKIKSPTFVLMKKYSTKIENLKLKIKNIYHLDCYRLRDHRDLLALGIKDILNNNENVILIEWPERIKKILPKKHIKIRIDHVDKSTRRITMN